jgi:hypothetical protein
MTIWRSATSHSHGSSATEPAGSAERESDTVSADGPLPCVTQRGRLDSKRRFTLAVIIGLAISAVPYLWVLWDLWNRSINFLRTAQKGGYASNFYDLQARAMFHGHLYVANGTLGGEAFVHAGRQYTYFGLFPSLLRMPVLVITHSLDGRLTAPSMLLAWLMAALFSALLMWRVRLLVRGPTVLGRTEAASYGVLLAAIMGGSVLMYLASNPNVFSEDLAWSVTLTIGSMFALLGVLERPSWGRVTASGFLILAANLDRATTGYACVIGAVLVAGWFALGCGGADNLRWWLPMLMAGVVPLGVSCAVSYAKFGVLFGLPASDQLVVYKLGLNRVNGGGYFSFHFLPSTLRAYLQPGGIRLTAVFPFVTLPTHPARAVGGVMLDGASRTASVPSSMPLLFLTGLWGLISAFRPRVVGRSVLIRIVLVAAAAGAGTVLIYGWIENRFVADFLPFLIVASAVGMVDVWRRVACRRPRDRSVVLVVIAALGVFGIAANVGIASSPQSTWSRTQLLHYVEFQNSVSNVTGHPLATNVVRGEVLPTSAPADQLFVADDCAGLYISLGGGSPNMHNIFVNSVETALLWYPVELGPGVRHVLDITFHGPVEDIGQSVPLLRVGAHTILSVHPYGTDGIRFGLKDPLGSVVGSPMRVEIDRTYQISFVTDQFLHSVSISSQQGSLLRGIFSGRGKVLVGTLRSSSRQPMTVTNASGPPPNVSLCRSLP